MVRREFATMAHGRRLLVHTMTRCPKCKSNLSKPASGDIVRCARCRSEFSFEEIFGKAKVAAAESRPESASPDWLNAEASESAQVATSEESKDEKAKYVRRRYYSRTRLPKKGAPPKPRRRRRKPKTKFTRGDFVKVILGALFAFPVAQLILWWGFHKDPFNLGKPVAQAIPLLVPRDFRGEAPVPESQRNVYVSSPDSNLQIGTPFDFHDPSNKRSSAIQRGMSPGPKRKLAPSEPVVPPTNNDDGSQSP